MQKKHYLVYLVLTVICLSLLATAAGAQKAITSADFERIQLYQTTKADVVKWFGPPSATEKVTGEEILTYQTNQKDPVTSKNVCNLLTVTIDADGTVSGAVFKKYCAP